MFNWLLPKKAKDTSVIGELAMRSSITDKLQNYNADEDTTISEFSLANDDKKSSTTGSLARVRNKDAWSQANPGETGKWKKENR